MSVNYIWLFGENLAKTSNNNSFYFWKQVVLKNDGIEKYIVLQKNDANKATYNNLSDEEKKFVVWKNSLKHFKIYFNADMYFVSLSYKDITPTKLFGYSVDYFIEKPLIYLQHGTLGIKSIEYKGWGYNNNMFRFIYYNKNIKPLLKEYNRFNDYQLYYGEYLPRYKELVKRQREYKSQKNNNNSKNILWFLTWREYLGKNYMTDILTRQISQFVSNQKLTDYLEKTNSTLTVCLHQFFDEEKISAFKENIKTDKIKFIHSDKTDVLDVLAKNDVLITDYSSVGFDFTTLNKPVILYQPDLRAYLTKRKLYCTIEELEKYSHTKSSEVIDLIVNESYTINDFFRSKLPEKIDYDYIEKGSHIEKMYDEFAKIQKNKITFIGYNFYGIGGTVFATRSLAEALLEKNYLVELLSLKCSCKPKAMPYGLQLTSLYKSSSSRKIERLKRWVFRLPALYGHLDYDCSKKNLSPYAGMAMRKTMKNIKSKTIVSTRESLHLFLNDATAKNIENKVYFFHCTAELVDDLFPTVIDKIKDFGIDKAVFVTEENRQIYLNKQKFDQYKEYIVLGNTLESSRSVTKDDILGIDESTSVLPPSLQKITPITPPAINEDNIFKGIYLVRISSERKSDLDNLIGFAKFLKERKVNNIRIDVFGNGDYLEKFLDIVYSNELEDYICYCGETSNPKYEFKKHDAVVDFTLKHSFGMPYIEALLNGKMLYCTNNTASKEVLNGIDGCIYNSYEELLDKINNFDKVTDEQILKNYEKISETYSRDILAKNFIDFINK